MKTLPTKHQDLDVCKLVLELPGIVAVALQTHAKEMKVIPRTLIYEWVQTHCAAEFARIVNLRSSDPDRKEDTRKALASINSRRWGYVYLLRRGNGEHKIGSAYRIGPRIKQLEAYYREPLVLVHAIETTDRVTAERTAHARYKDKRIDPGCDWFKLTSDDVTDFNGLKASDLAVVNEAGGVVAELLGVWDEAEPTRVSA